MKILLLLLLFTTQINAQGFTAIQNTSKEYWDVTVTCKGKLIFSDIMSPGDLFSWVSYGREIKVTYRLMTNRCKRPDLKSRVCYRREAGFNENKEWVGTRIIQLIITGECEPKA